MRLRRFEQTSTHRAQLILEPVIGALEEDSSQISNSFILREPLLAYANANTRVG